MLQYVLAFQMQYIIEQEQAYLMDGLIPPYAPSKSYMSQELAWEIEGLQDYVAALATHDLMAPGTPFVTFAFDLDANDPVTIAQGVAD